MRRRLVLIILTVFILLQALVPAASAAVVKEGYRVTDESEIENDLANMLFEDGAFDASRYPTNASDKYFYVMRFLEVGYNNGKFDETGGLYLFVYNPARMDLSTMAAQNSVTMALASDETYVKYPLEYCDGTDDMRFLKYRVLVTASDLNAKLSDKVTRLYKISEIELYQSGLNARSYTVGGEYKYSGSGSDLFCYAKDMVTIELDIHSTYYRPDVMASGGLDTRNELHSVYFSVPNKVLKEYGELYSVQGEYYEQRICSVVTENKMFSKVMVDWIGSEVESLPQYEEGRKASMIFPALLGDFRFSSSSDGTFTSTYGIGLNKSYKESLLSQCVVVNRLPNIPYIFYEKEIIPDRIAVSSEDIKNAVQDYGLITMTGSANTEKTPYDISVEDGYELKSYASTHSDFETFFAKLSTWFQQDISTDVVIDTALEPIIFEDMYSYSDSRASLRYYVAETDVMALRNEVYRAEVLDKTTYLLRFDTSESRCYEMDFWSQDSGITDNDDDKTYLFEQNYYKDFDVLSLTFGDEHRGCVVVPVATDPEDVVGDIVITEDGKFSWKDLINGEDPYGLWKKLIAIVLILLIVAGVVILLYFFGGTWFQMLSLRLDAWWRRMSAKIRAKINSGSKRRYRQNFPKRSKKRFKGKRKRSYRSNKGYKKPSE